LKARTKRFALRVLELVGSLRRSPASEILGRQLLRAATSVGANYRAACRARSKSDFISRITIVEEEVDECCYWLELLGESGIVEQSRVSDLWSEADELTAIFVAAGRTANNRGQWNSLEFRELDRLQTAAYSESACP
jgi:four helix bundle protein